MCVTIIKVCLVTEVQIALAPASSVETKSCTLQSPKSTTHCQIAVPITTAIHKIIMFPQRISGGFLMNIDITDSLKMENKLTCTCQEESLNDAVSSHFKSQLR